MVLEVDYIILLHAYANGKLAFGYQAVGGLDHGFHSNDSSADIRYLP